MLSATTRAGSRTASLTLVALESLPCGCVSSVYCAQPSVVELELLEAKGPHCVFHGHRTGSVVRLGVPDFSPVDGDEPLV